MKRQQLMALFLASMVFFAMAPVLGAACSHCASSTKATCVKAPTASFTTNLKSGNAPLTVKFFDKSSGSIASRCWTFGDGTKSTLKNPTHTYKKAGKYKVTLTVKNCKGTSVKSTYITVTSCKSCTKAVKACKTCKTCRCK